MIPLRQIGVLLGHLAVFQLVVLYFDAFQRAVSVLIPFLSHRDAVDFPVPHKPVLCIVVCFGLVLKIHSLREFPVSGEIRSFRESVLCLFIVQCFVRPVDVVQAQQSFHSGLLSGHRFSVLLLFLCRRAVFSDRIRGFRFRFKLDFRFIRRFVGFRFSPFGRLAGHLCFFGALFFSERIVIIFLKNKLFRFRLGVRVFQEIHARIITGNNAESVSHPED